MNKTVVRYFFDFLEGQEEWLNNMTERDYRLKRYGKMTYTFDGYEPNEYEHAVELVGDQAYSKAKDCRKYFESMGFRALTEDISLNFPYGKIRWWPYAKGVGQIAVLLDGFDKELSISGKKGNKEPFELHIDIHDERNLYKTVRRTYVWAALMVIPLGIMTFIPNVVSVSTPMVWTFRIVLLIFGGLFAVPTVKYLSLVRYLKEESKTFEQQGTHTIHTTLSYGMSKNRHLANDILRGHDGCTQP